MGNGLDVAEPLGKQTGRAHLCMRPTWSCLWVKRFNKLLRIQTNIMYVSNMNIEKKKISLKLLVSKIIFHKRHNDMEHPIRFILL